MVSKSVLHSTRCAICLTEGNATELYAANFDENAFNVAVFSARRLPDRVHYRLVKCNRCGLVRSDPIVDLDTLYRLYSRSVFTYDEEVPDLLYTYGSYLAKLDQLGVNKGSLLEIGGGNGFFLETALDQDYKTVCGVEPSSQAVENASPRIKPFMICDVMRPGLFEADTFDAICIFQVFDHIVEPGAMLDECYKVLRPGGFLLAFNHNVEALSARLLGERSPIIDIEHTYLYSFQTMAHIARDHHFEVRKIDAAYNRYKLQYLARLLPVPQRIKELTLVWLKRSGLGKITLSVPLGNLYLIGQKSNL